MKFLARNYENTSLDYRFIRAMGSLQIVIPCALELILLVGKKFNTSY